MKNVITFCFGLFLCIVSAHLERKWVLTIYSHVTHRPDPLSIKLPDFQGRVLMASDFTKPTPTLQTNFKDIDTWDHTSLLVINREDRDFQVLIHLTAWRQDPTTSGLWQKAEHVTPVEWPSPTPRGMARGKNIMYTLEKFSIGETGTIIAYPRISILSLFMVTLISLLFLGGLCLGLYIMKNILREKKV